MSPRKDAQLFGRPFVRRSGVGDPEGAPAARRRTRTALASTPRLLDAYPNEPV